MGGDCAIKPAVRGTLAGRRAKKIGARDRYRLTFQNYGVSGTPTFVLIDEAGKVQHYKTGYAPMIGLGIEGWEWHREDARPTKAEAANAAIRAVAVRGPLPVRND
jgi:hypothetical protein